MRKVYEESADRLRVAAGELDKMMQLYKQEQLLRKKYHNTIQDMKGAVRVRTPVNNIEYFPPNFEGLVLGCIDADFCK